MIYEIKSRQNDKIKEVVKLSNMKSSKEAKLFKIEGFHAFEMALEAKAVKSVFTYKEIKDLPSNIPQYIVSKEIMEKISYAKNPQGVVVVCNYIPVRAITSNKVLLLDDVCDPGNVGTLLRTALAFGYKDVIMLGGCSQYNEKVLQSTQGAIFKLNIVNDIDINSLKDYEILATEIKGSVELSKVTPGPKHILVLGNEAHGVSNKILSLASKRIRIDISDIESLNVAVAGAIAMYKLSN
ncbi:MAG: RNA methyltransferase [Bacilli bacterium]|nr:RNA methyltransferase [Bacilli bacterium]